MDEHHKPVHHNIEQADSTATTEDGMTAAKFISFSVLAGAVLICAAMFYNFNLLIKALDNGGGVALQGSGQPAANPSPAPSPAPAAAPTGPVTIADRADEPVEGKTDAKVTIQEFGDFQCPFCQSFFKDTLPQIKSKYIDTGKVKLIFRHFPLPFHVNAQISGVAAECANQQGKFWQYHDLLYTNGQGDGTNLDKASLEKYADQLGLNKGTLGFGANKFNQCLESNATLKIVQADQAEGTKDGVSGTPTFYINGVQIVGAQPFASFQTAIDTALAK